MLMQSKLITSQEIAQTSQQKLLAAENQSKDKEIELVKVQANLEIEKTHRKNAENQRDELNQQLEKLKNRGLLDRILNRN